MNKNLCESCGANSLIFPLVQCRDNPYPSETPEPVTTCNRYYLKGTPWCAIRFTFSDGSKKEFRDLLRLPIAFRSIKHNGERPVVADISAGGELTDRDRLTVEKMHTMTKLSLHPTKGCIIYHGVLTEELCNE